MGRIDHDYAAEIRRSLSDPRRLCERLGLLEGAERQATGLLVRCPAHGDRKASCSVTRGADGTIRCKCFACDWSGDALTLVAVVHGLDTRTQFPEVLLAAADVGGLQRVLDELRGGKPFEPRPAAPRPAVPAAEPDYPPLAEVEALWSAAGPCASDEDSAWHLEGRGIDPRAASQRGLARALVLGTGLWCQMPRWARYRGDWWPANGYRIIVPTFDPKGAMRGVRAWRVTTGGDAPKRLPPAGHKAVGLALANPVAVALLQGRQTGPARVVLSEGEPDFLTLALRWPDLAVFGVISGSWTAEFAERIPFGSLMIVRTHHDEAGERYASEVIRTVKGRAVVKRSAA